MNINKITLHNLYESTEQEVFDFVAHHLLTQDNRSTNETGCAYRSESGLMCAAGCLMTDAEAEQADGLSNGTDWESVVNAHLAPSYHFELICRLQSIHDGQQPKEWKLYLSELADEYELNVDVLKSAA